VITAESGNGADWAKPKNKSTWPIIVFLGFIFSGPYLIWKLIGSLNLNKKGGLVFFFKYKVVLNMAMDHGRIWK